MVWVPEMRRVFKTPSVRFCYDGLDAFPHFHPGFVHGMHLARQFVPLALDLADLRLQASAFLPQDADGVHQFLNPLVQGF